MYKSSPRIVVPPRIVGFPRVVSSPRVVGSLGIPDRKRCVVKVDGCRSVVDSSRRCDLYEVHPVNHSPSV